METLGARIPDQFGEDRERAEIFTLGRFMIRRGGKVLSECSVRAEKVWTLFKYLLTCRGKTLTAERIMDTVWPDQDCKDPYQVLRSLIYRLRRLLADELGAPELASNIVFAHGCYRWSETLNERLDVEAFEKRIDFAMAVQKTDVPAACEALQKALPLYLGDYLPDCSHHDWVAPSRDYYHRLYIKSVLNLAKLLRTDGAFSRIVSLCREALEIEYFEEELHLYYLEALIEKGQYEPARRHYETITAVFYREMGIKPSAAMRQLYGRIRFIEDEIFNLNLPLIQERLNDRHGDTGAFLCDPELFRYIYQLERIRQDRSGQSACLALLALTGPDYRIPAREMLRCAMEALLGILRTNLRKGDVICRTHEAQYLLILPNVDEARSTQVLGRIDGIFQRSVHATDLLLHQRRQVLLSRTPPVFARQKESTFFTPNM